jgi:hypothetical protein
MRVLSGYRLLLVTGAAGALALNVGCSGPIVAQDTLGRPKVGDTVSQSTKSPPADGEYRRGNGPAFSGIGCTMVAPPASPQDVNSNHCLRLGPLQVAMEFGTLQKALIALDTTPERSINEPRQVGATPDGGRTLMVPLATVEQGGKTGLVSYLVVIVDKANRVEALQITGRASAASERLPFSSIRLGTPQDRVIDLLGLPSAVTDVPQIKGSYWSYAPFTFSVEIVNGQVYSVRLQRAGKSDGRPFVPLSALPQ